MKNYDICEYLEQYEFESLSKLIYYTLSPYTVNTMQNRLPFKFSIFVEIVFFCVLYIYKTKLDNVQLMSL